ncbi:MAG: DUF1206 domain-containing protein [Candidatus Altiarchaeota archaeon]
MKPKKIRKKLAKKLKILGKPGKAGKKLKKKTGKNARHAYCFAERTRGVITSILGLTLILAAFIASPDRITGLKDIAGSLVHHWLGRTLLFAIGLAYLTYGLWKLIMGGD